MEDKELLKFVENNKPKSGIKFNDLKEVFEFGLIRLKLKGIVEPNYGRMRLEFELYLSKKLIKSFSNYSYALDFNLVDYANEDYVYIPSENRLIIIELKSQTIKQFKYPEAKFSYINKVKFKGQKLLFATKNSFWMLNLKKNSLKVYSKENLKDPVESKVYNNMLIDTYEPSYLKRIMFKLR